MVKSILFIDGENFLHKIEEVLKEEGIDKDKLDLASIDLDNLFKESLKQNKTDPRYSLGFGVFEG